MSLVELFESVEFVTDAEGHKKVMLDWEVWEKVVAMLEEFQPKTPLGRQLWAARIKILASGSPTLNWMELEQEIANRRGEQYHN